MMNTKFNKFERVAGLFVLFAVLGAIVTAISVAMQRGWLAPKDQYHTSFENADGVHTGTSVQIAGIRAGSVEDVELGSDNKIHITFDVFKKFSDRIRQDSKAQLVRPFIIGDRVLEITVGKDNTPRIADNGSVESYETMDLMTIFSGRKLSDYLSTMAGLIDNLKILVNAFNDKTRTESFVKIFDQMEPLVVNLNTMSKEVVKLSKQATHHENLGNVLQNVTLLTNEINHMLPIVKQQAPALSHDLHRMILNLTQLTEDFKLLTPTIVEVAPLLPKTSQRAIEALNEAVVLIKAMQKSMFMKSNVDEVRVEEIQAKNKNAAATDSEIAKDKDANKDANKDKINSKDNAMPLSPAVDTEKREPAADQK